MSEPISYVRSSAIALSYEARTGLNYVSQATGINNTDQLGDTIIREWLETKHPDVMAHIKQRQQRDNEFRDALKAKLNPDPFAPAIRKEDAQ